MGVLDPAAIERDTQTLAVADLARYLQATLGQRTVAYVAGLRDPKAIGQWAARRAEPKSGMVKTRLRYAYEITRLITDSYGAETATAWLLGSNTRLDDVAPAYVLRHAVEIDDLRFLVPAARAFAGSAS